MLAIRFHGRGGQGTKTASRMVGSAAYLAGFHAQDSPIYGAERRGAPVVAFTRINPTPIRERGVIENPDLIVLADDSLLRDPMAGVLTGQQSASALFVNSTDPDRLMNDFNIQVPLLTSDLTGLSREAFGSRFTLSAAMAGVAARLCGGITVDQLGEAIKLELPVSEFGSTVIGQNIQVAEQAFNAVETIAIKRAPRDTSAVVAPVTFERAGATAPSVVHPGTSELKNTGTWRVERPVIDHERCTKCGLCVIYCPDGAMRIERTGLPEVDYDHCKGCMICREICPPHCINTEKEASAC